MEGRRTVVIEGTIGSGKTLVLERLKRRLPRTRVFPEPVANWSYALGEFHAAGGGEEKRAALVRLQIAVASSLIKRNADVESHVRENPDSLAILERSLLSGADFARASARLLDARDLRALVELAVASYSAFATPRLRICLVAEPAACLERIARRGRPEEAGVRLEYLAELDKVIRRFAGLRGDAVVDTTHLSPPEVEERVVRLLEDRLLL